jgi:hexosaminidase
MRALVIGTMFGWLCSVGLAQSVSPLFARGYTVIPEPQTVSLGTHDFTFGSNWQLKVDKSVAEDDVALEALHEDLATRFHVTLGASGSPRGVLSLQIEPGSVKIGKAQDPNKSSLEEQAYRIHLESAAIKITANAPTGLFYGVETLIQLVRLEEGALTLPEGTIEDWPDLELRQIYWDDAHHLDRMDDLKQAMKQAAFYKMNGFVIKLEGHFQYKSAPAIVEPYALSPAELQELTNYGLHYHIELIPYLDGPAHIAFILKHPEYAKLREFPDSNYEICATNPDSYKLLEGMYQDLLDANRGVKYFLLSTDEPYYLGLAHTDQCNEADMAKSRGSVGQVFASFVNQTAAYLHDHGRTVMFWGEYPLKPTDVQALPPYVVNGEVYGPEFDREFHRRGIQQMIFTSAQGGNATLFPSYFPLPQEYSLHQPKRDTQHLVTTDGITSGDNRRVDDIMNKITFESARMNTSVIGEINCGWADNGLHTETFWLGYVSSGAAGWHPGTNPEELTNTFYPLFYGPGAVRMNTVYQMMSYQAESWEDSWETENSKARKPIWGWSYGIFQTPRPAKDQTLPLPPAPSPDLSYHSEWSEQNAKRIQLALGGLRRNEVLQSLIEENMARVQFNHYNLEVFLSVANLYQQNLEMISEIHDMDLDLIAADQARSMKPELALRDVDQALDTAATIWRKRNEVLQNTITTWDMTWFPRVAEANGRQYLHALDDVKDHLPDRTVDMSYLVYRETLLPFGDWVNSIFAARNQFARAHQLPVVEYHLAWDDFTVAPPSVIMHQ